MKKKPNKKLTYSQRVAILSKMVEYGEECCDGELLEQCLEQDVHQYLKYAEKRDQRRSK